MGDSADLLISWMPFEYTRAKLTEAKDGTSAGKVILKGVIQKADTLNQNGRVYPRAILEREVRNYQKFIRERRALGECVDPETEIFTTRGWIPVDQVTDSEVVFTLNLSSGRIEEQQILAKVSRQHVGKMLHFRNEILDMLVTPNHKVLVFEGAASPIYLPASDLVNHLDDADKSTLSFRFHDPSSGCTSWIKVPDAQVKEVDYDGTVHCVTTPNGNWLARRSGVPFWTGNCDHPESSVVELKNCSHLITEAYMQADGTVVGTVELLDTPAGKILQSLVESNVTLGISSRGVGSTRKDGDRQIVQDDFQIICWDMVSEPSTGGAFLFKEAAVRRVDLDRHFMKSDKVDRIFNEILAWRRG